LDFYTIPESDGTPDIEPSYPDPSTTEIITDDFIFVATDQTVDELLEMPLLVTYVDRNTHWKSL
jgi:hypothetical protein